MCERVVLRAYVRACSARAHAPMCVGVCVSAHARTHHRMPAAACRWFRVWSQSVGQAVGYAYSWTVATRACASMPFTTAEMPPASATRRLLLLCLQSKAHLTGNSTRCLPPRGARSVRHAACNATQRNATQRNAMQCTLVGPNGEAQFRFRLGQRTHAESVSSAAHPFSWTDASDGCAIIAATIAVMPPASLTRSCASKSLTHRGGY